VNVRFTADPTSRWRGDEGLQWVESRPNRLHSCGHAFDRCAKPYLDVFYPWPSRVSCGGKAFRRFDRMPKIGDWRGPPLCTTSTVMSKPASAQNARMRRPSSAAPAGDDWPISALRLVLERRGGRGRARISLSKAAIRAFQCLAQSANMDIETTVAVGVSTGSTFPSGLAQALEQMGVVFRPKPRDAIVYIHIKCRRSLRDGLL
jgi:hypothetical protein